MVTFPTLRTATTMLAAAGLSLVLSTNANATTLNLWLDIGGVIYTASGTNSISLAPTTINGVQIEGEYALATNGPDYGLSWSANLVQNTNNTPITISGILSASDFTGPANYVQFSQSGTFSNTTGSQISVAWYDDPENTLGANGAGDTPGDLLGTYTSAPATGNGYSISYNSGLLALLNPDLSEFSMTEAFTYTLAAGGYLVSRGTTMIKSYVPVPEPTTLLLLGAGMFGFGFARRMRHQTA